LKRKSESNKTSFAAFAKLSLNFGLEPSGR
jgi:hypothetical protein